MNDPRLAVVLLAAGASTRYGGPKALAPLRGQAMICHLLETLRALDAPITVVLGAYAEEIRPVLPTDVTLQFAAAWQHGQAHSLTAGIQAVAGECDAALVALADQPVITADDFTALKQRWLTEPARIAAARYLGRLGAPAIFPCTYFSRLLALDGDEGGRSLLRTENCLAVDLPNAAFDIDRPADWAALGDILSPR